MTRLRTAGLAWLAVAAVVGANDSHAQTASPPLGGFIPLVGIAMTDESKTLDALDLGDIPFIADPAFSQQAPLLGSGGGYFDVALLDTGAATHIITQQAFDGFDIIGNQLRGTGVQDIGGATGVITTEINDAAGFYTAGLGDRTAEGAELKLDTNKLRGQTSFATLTAPDEWTLPNILGLPMAAQHGIVIRNSDPVIFQHEFPRQAAPGQPAPSRTVRTPQVELIDLGTGDQEGITRRAPLILNPGIGFIQGPQFVFNLGFDDILTGGGDIDIANNPASPSVVIDSNSNGGGLFLEVDMVDGGNRMDDRQLLFDTGASLTVVSQIMAKRLGFDAVLDKPDFELQVEGSGGVQGGVPGFYLDELNIDTIGGDFTLQNVPIAVLDVTNPNDPGNIIDGIVGMNLFNGRDIVIDAEASFGQGGNGPSLYIGDKVTNVRTWLNPTIASRGGWLSASRWAEGAVPDGLSDVLIAPQDGVFSAETVDLNSAASANRMTVRGTNETPITFVLEFNAELTVFADVMIEDGGRILMDNGRLDAQLINIFGGELGGFGDIFVGNGPITSNVRNLGGVVRPETLLAIDGDFSNAEDGTFATTVINSRGDRRADQLTASRFVFLDGTLEVDLSTGSQDLTIGDLFTIITAGDELFGQFENLVLPYEYDWQVNYSATDVTLEVIGENALGDFNGDGLVNPADYTVWRDGYNTQFTIGDFLDWKNAMLGGGGGASRGLVPEPGAAALLLMAAPLFGRVRRRW
ncbi:MAG: retropepsin-like aspartic protease [Planctomycetota bacterium]